MYSSAFCLVTLLLGSDPYHLPKDDLLREIRASYRERTNAIRTLRVLCRQMPPLGTDGEYSDDIDEKHLEWSLFANKQRLKREPWANSSVPADLSPTAQWDSFDGAFGYQVVFWPRNPEIVSKIFRSKSLPSAIRNNPLPACLGIQLPFSSIRLADQLQRSGTQVVSRESIGDATCTKVELEPYEAVPGVKHRLFAWFDNDREFVLQRLELGPARLFKHQSENPQVPFHFQKDETYTLFNTVAVRSFHDPISDSERWFPVSWATTLDSKPWLVIDDVVINPTLASSEFVPDFPRGAEVVNLHKQGKPDDSYVVGGEEGLAIRRRYMKDNREAAPDATPSTFSPLQRTFEHDARPPQPVAFHKWALLISGFCCLVVLFGCSCDEKDEVHCFSLV